MGNFVASGILHLKHKLGPILWQLPPQFHYDEERLESFFRVLPRTLEEAILSSEKADRVTPSIPEGIDLYQPLRHALEVRSDTFENPDFVDLLRASDVALVFADSAGLFPYMEDLTSDFVYLRLHGEEKLYAGGYSDESLVWWSERLKLWQKGKEPKDALTISEQKFESKPRDVFVYFDNDINTRAPFDAMRLAEYLSKTMPKPTPKPIPKK